MLRVEVSDANHGALPAIDIADSRFVIGSGPNARVRLPADVADAQHIRIDAGRYDVVDGRSGDIGEGVVVAVGSYQVRIAPSPAGAAPTPPQRTESLARELMRSLLGTDSAPSLEVERGVIAGASRMLAPPDSTLTIGRGDDAGWIIADEDLSRVHAEIRRTWDGIRIVDLGSKNGTRVDGIAIGRDGVDLRDGMLVELGTLALRVRDPVTRGATKVIAAVPAPVTAPRERASTLPFYAALVILVVALGGLVWTLTL